MATGVFCFVFLSEGFNDYPFNEVQVIYIQKVGYCKC
jgi:hypothetical protein